MSADVQYRMPEPFFDATTRNYCVEHGLMRARLARDPRLNERALGAFNLPPFQRPSVWSRKQSVRFIESIWLRLPIASYVLNVDDQHDLGYPCDNWLLDGQQRWTAINEYANDMFPVFGFLYSELTTREKRRFGNSPFPAIESRNLTPQQCEDVYNRLAYGGTEHKPKRKSQSP